MSTEFIKQLRAGCIHYHGQVDEAGADRVMARAANEIEHLKCEVINQDEELRRHQEQMAELLKEHAKMKETLRHILACNFTTDALQGFIGSVVSQIKK